MTPTPINKRTRDEKVPPATTGSRTVISLSPVLNVVREYDAAAHESPEKRGGYLRLEPGEVPTIILDGLASDAEQLDAELRCRRELNLVLADRDQRVESQKDDSHVAARRRELLHYSAEVIISRDSVPEDHNDPQRRGGYLRVLPGRIPEVILDGLADEAEQDEALTRCLRSLELSQSGPSSLRLLPQLLAPVQRSGGGASARHQGASPSAPRPTRTPRLGERLVADGLLSHAELTHYLREQQRLTQDGVTRRLGSLLVAAGRLTAAQVAKVLGAQHGVRPTASAATRVDPRLRGLFTAALLQEVQAAPLFISGKTVVMALCDPQDAARVALLQAHTELRVEPMQATQHQVEMLLRSLSPTGPAAPAAEAPSQASAVPAQASALPSQASSVPSRTSSVPSRTSSVPSRVSGPSQSSGGPSRASSVPSRVSDLSSRASGPSQSSGGPSRASGPSQSSGGPSRVSGPSQSSGVPSRTSGVPSGASGPAASRTSGAGTSQTSASPSRSTGRPAGGEGPQGSGTSAPLPTTESQPTRRVGIGRLALQALFGEKPSGDK